LVTEDWYFVSHRLPMASAARRAGYEVHVLTNVADHSATIEGHGFHLHPLSWRRGSMNPLDVIAIVREVRRHYRALAPDLVHHVALQPAIIGSLAALGLPIVRLNALAGLGFAFASQAAKAQLVRPVLAALLWYLLKGPRAAVLVQNPDDRTAVRRLGINADRVFLIPGSGVDVDSLRPLPEPDGAMSAAFVGRLLDDKGVRTLVAAHELLAERQRPIRTLIAGEPDSANPASIPAADIEAWKRRSGLTVLGHVANIRDVWSAAHIAVLPSRREGLPKSLLEAAACGRPIVASNVPGCREIARADVNALLVPPDDHVALADAIDRLARDPDLRRRLGQAGRRIVEQEFSSERIGRETVALYDRLLGRNVLRAAVADG
jgi:glycosyltransferase involved in cell wall biosynthesis